MIPITGEQNQKQKNVQKNFLSLFWNALTYSTVVRIPVNTRIPVNSSFTKHNREKNPNNKTGKPILS